MSHQRKHKEGEKQDSGWCPEAPSLQRWVIGERRKSVRGPKRSIDAIRDGPKV